MNLILGVLQLYTPGCIKRSRLIELFRLTADAFGRELPEAGRRTHENILNEYALFTVKACKDIMEKNPAEINGIKERLYNNARELGEKLRKTLCIKDIGQAMRAGRMLYRVIRIDFQGGKEGIISVNKCFFSKYYTPGICEIMSSIDDGIMSGLSDGGKLSFSQRITEGKECCKAVFKR